jgi:hypothetical protein
MADRKQGKSLPHPYVMQMTSREIVFGDNGNSILIGILPLGAIVTNAIVFVKTVFNAGTAAVLDVGTTADDDEFMADVDIKTATGRLFDATTMNLAATELIQLAERKVYAKPTLTGTAATTGALRVVIEYVQTDSL